MLGACEFDLRDSPEAFKGKTRGCGGGGGGGSGVQGGQDLFRLVDHQTQ